MIIKCPECDLPVSDKAPTCPHCGYPLLPSAVKSSRTSSRRKRLPNGFGQITKLKKSNLRNPYRAMVTVGKKATGGYIRKLLKPTGYFATYNDAYKALVEYSKNPYDLEPSITIKQLYDKWSEVYFSKLESASSIRTIESAWAYCTDGQTHLSDIKLTYDKYEYRFEKIRDQLGLNDQHRAHDPRKQFATMCKNAGVDEYALKRMIGHKISDITENVYTDRDKNWLKTEIEKI